MNRTDQTRIGLSLAGLIVGAWLGVHIYAVFFLQWTPAAWVVAPLLLALETWLSVGMFIVAHDAMHGSLAPGRTKLNRMIGRTCVALYAGFSYDKLYTAHHLHHANPGSAEDPDFHVDDPHSFWPWFLNFFRTYFGLRQFALITLWTAVEIIILHARVQNVMLFWAVPALLSALQLFLFGTWLPHRHSDAPFDNPSNTRSSTYPWLVSLLTCFHFGYHIEHHTRPDLPWWRLPEARPDRAGLQSRAGG